jgi:hypothetical protein
MPKVGDPLGPATAELLKGKKLEMRKKSPLLSALPLLPLILFTSAASAQDATDSLEIPKEVQSLINHRCIECHGEDASEGNIRLDSVSSLERDAQLELMNKVQEQLFFGTMPPEQEEQPTNAERQRLTGWLSSVLKKYHATTFESKLLLPQGGNYVDHDKLFSGEIKDKPFSPARRWIVSPYIFDNRVIEIFGITNGRLPEGVVNEKRIRPDEDYQIVFRCRVLARGNVLSEFGKSNGPCDDAWSTAQYHLSDAR